MIETYYIYKGVKYGIQYDEYLEEWKCEDFGIHNDKLKGLQKEIENRANNREKLQKQKTKRIKCLIFDYKGARDVESTSVVYNYSYAGEFCYEAWIKDKDGRRKTYIKNLYKVDDEIENLLSALSKIEKRISEWQKKNQYTPKELIKEMGYSPEYAKQEFKIEI